MRRLVSVIGTFIILGFSFLLPFTATAATTPSLIISQFKITSSSGQFFMLYNASNETQDMGLVQLVYYNNYNLVSATSSKIIQLAGKLEPHSYYLVNDGPLTLCYQMVVNSVSLGLSTTAGTVQVQRLTQSSPGAAVTSELEDYVSWSKSSVPGVQKLPASTNQFQLRQPVDANHNPMISSAGQGSWQTVEPNAVNPCNLTTTTVTPAVVQTSMLLLSSTPPPVTVISLTASSSGPYLPASDIGLMAPVINEVEPNPKSPQKDADDEFIELYNPNDKTFDLTGFSLETGTDNKYKKKFADGTKLPPKSFVAFFSSGTGLTLSNSSGQARLLDPFGSIISTSKEYSDAKEGQSWALANSEWYWTSQPTPNEANIINNAGSSGSTANNASGGAVQGASSTSNNLSSLSTPTTSQTAPQVATLHPSTLAGVVALTLGYGAYEYRQDISNRLRQLRNYRASRRGASE